MNRAPIVIGSTVFGTAAVLGFHAHPVAVPTATAQTKTATTPQAALPTLLVTTTVNDAPSSPAVIGGVA